MEISAGDKWYLGWESVRRSKTDGGITPVKWFRDLPIMSQGARCRAHTQHGPRKEEMRHRPCPPVAVHRATGASYVLLPESKALPMIQMANSPFFRS